MKKKVVLFIGFVLLAVSAVWAGGDPGEYLLDAAKSSDVPALREALDNGANVDYRNDALDKTALMIACENQWLAGVKMLVDEGANPSYKNRAGVTAIMLASKTNRDDKILRYIVEHAGDANLNNKDSQGETALMYAIHNASISALRVLLDYGANPDAANDDGMDAYMYAVQKGAEKHLKILLDKGNPNWEKIDSSGFNIFMLAVTKKKTGMLNTLLSGYSEIDLTKPLPNSDLPLVWLIKTKQSLEIIKLIMDSYGSDARFTQNIEVNRKPILLWAIEVRAPNEVIGRMMRSYRKTELLNSLQDEEGDGLNEYIEQANNAYARSLLNRLNGKKTAR